MAFDLCGLRAWKSLPTDWADRGVYLLKTARQQFRLLGKHQFQSD